MTDLRRRAGAGALIGAPLLLLAAHLLQPSHDPDTASEVAAQAQHVGAFTASTIVGFLAMLLLVPAVVTLAGLLSDRWTGHIGGALALTGALGLTFLLGTGVGATTIAHYAGSDAVSLTDHLQSDPGFGVAVGAMLIGYTFGLIVLAVGLWRAGLLPVWAAAAMAVSPVVPAVAGSRTPVAIGFVLLLVGFGAAALAAVGRPAGQTSLVAATA